jgi:hypothetical protein
MQLHETSWHDKRGSNTACSSSTTRERGDTMPRTPSFNFGANAKPKKAKSSKRKSSGKSRGNKSNAWRAYVGGISNAPIPD